MKLWSFFSSLLSYFLSLFLSLSLSLSLSEDMTDLRLLIPAVVYIIRITADLV